MKRLSWWAVGGAALILMAWNLWGWHRSHEGLDQNAAAPRGSEAVHDEIVSSGSLADPPQTRNGSGQHGAPLPSEDLPHPLLGMADQRVLPSGDQAPDSTIPQIVSEAVLEAYRSLDSTVELATITIDYPLEETIFPPEIIAPTFLWHDLPRDTDTWLIDVAVEDNSSHTYVLASGRPPSAGQIDPSCIAEGNEIYQPTPYQASAASWTPDASLWERIKRGSVETPATVTIVGFSSGEPGKILARGRVSLTTSKDPVGAPIFYRDVPLAPAITEKFVIQPLSEEAVSLIGWRLRDISKPESRLLLTDVPTCTNCHSFSADGKTMGMDLDGPQGDKGAYVITSITKETRFESQDVISWNSFPGKPPKGKTIGFLSRISPDGQYVATTLNEAVYVCNFMDYRFLQVFFPTRGILGYHRRSTGEIKTLPGAADPRYVHCDPVWTPDGQTLVFARAEARDPYPEHGQLPERANDVAERQIQYDLYRIGFRDGEGGTPEPIEGASNNGMSNNFPKVSPDGRWLVFVQCRNGQLMRPDSKLWIVPAAGGTPRLMRCNTSLMNSWHSFSPNSRWLVFSSKSNTPYTQMFLTHIDQDGNDSPAVLIPNSTAANRAVNIPEFVNLDYDELVSIDVPALEYYRHAKRGLQLSREGKLEAAIAEFDLALKIQPDFEDAHIEAALLLIKQGQTDEAARRLHQALKLDPNQSRALGHLGILLARSGKLAEAAASFYQALQINPDYRTAHANLGRIHLEQGDLDQARAHFQAAMELDPNDPLGRFELGDVMLRQKSYGKAAEQFRATISLNPQDMDAYLSLSKTLSALGDYRSAVSQLEKALTIDGNNVRVVADLAWLLTICPSRDVRDGPRAVELAKRACAVTGNRNPVLLNTLAAAQAESGDFPEAVQTAARALEVLGPQNAGLESWLRQNLELFQAGKPCRPLAADGKF